MYLISTATNCNYFPTDHKSVKSAYLDGFAFVAFRFASSRRTSESLASIRCFWASSLAKASSGGVISDFGTARTALANRLNLACAESPKDSGRGWIIFRCVSSFSVNRNGGGVNEVVWCHQLYQYPNLVRQHTVNVPWRKPICRFESCAGSHVGWWCNLVALRTVNAKGAGSSPAYPAKSSM